MATFLFLSSFVMFQLPFGIWQDTVRRFKKMQYYDRLCGSTNSFDYEFENGRFEDHPSLAKIVFFSGVLLALIPLFLGLNFHWLILIVGNIVSLYFITPWLGFFIYPTGTIYTIRFLKVKAIQCIVIGAVLLIIALIIK